MRPVLETQIHYIDAYSPCIKFYLLTNFQTCMWELKSLVKNWWSLENFLYRSLILFLHSIFNIHLINLKLFIKTKLTIRPSLFHTRFPFLWDIRKVTKILSYLTLGRIRISFWYLVQNFIFWLCAACK